MTLKEILDNTDTEISIDPNNEEGQMVLETDITNLIELLWDRTDLSVEKTVDLYYDRFEKNFDSTIPDEIRAKTVEEIEDDFNAGSEP